MDSSGRLRYTIASRPWFQLGLLGPRNRDSLKRKNRATYPALLHSMLNLPGEVSRPVLILTEKEIDSGRRLIDGKGMHIGLNTGGSGRWELKKLSETKTVDLAIRLRKLPDARVWLLGGPEEHQRNERIARAISIDRVPTTIRIREFAGVIAHLRLLVTSDSLALHIALALGIPTVVFFGPTSAAEIDLYGSGKKVLPAEGFRCFYSAQCSHIPSCETFQQISPIVEAAHDVIESTIELRPNLVPVVSLADERRAA
jgi:ADP-heptose:LPS heptosyltransferase